MFFSDPCSSVLICGSFRFGRQNLGPAAGSGAQATAISTVTATLGLAFTTPPLFVAADRHDFRLLRNSPALKCGFKPIDLSEVGVRGKFRKQVHDTD